MNTPLLLWVVVMTMRVQGERLSAAMGFPRSADCASLRSGFPLDGPRPPFVCHLPPPGRTVPRALAASVLSGAACPGPGSACSRAGPPAGLPSEAPSAGHPPPAHRGQHRPRLHFLLFPR